MGAAMWLLSYCYLPCCCCHIATCHVAAVTGLLPCYLSHITTCHVAGSMWLVAIWQQQHGSSNITAATCMAAGSNRHRYTRHLHGSTRHLHGSRKACRQHPDYLYCQKQCNNSAVHQRCNSAARPAAACLQEVQAVSGATSSLLTRDPGSEWCYLQLAYKRFRQ
jgi:hypothetical protein